MKPCLVILALLLGMSQAGCVRLPRSQAMHFVWADFNIYNKPALAYEQFSHLPSPPQHVLYFRWLHEMAPPRPTIASAPVSSLSSDQGYYVPQQESPQSNSRPPAEMAPVPQPLLGPGAAGQANPLSTQPLLPERQESPPETDPREDSNPPNQPATPIPPGQLQPVPDLRPALPMAPPPGPSAQRQQTSPGIGSVQPASHTIAVPALPSSSVIFARP